MSDPFAMQDAEISLGNSLGGVLAFARESRGIPIEQAARETRIRVGRLREIEADNLDRLSPGYARLFVLDYARYLRVPETAVRPFLPQDNAFGIQRCGYIRRASDFARRFLRASRTPPRRSRVFLAVCGILILAVGGFQTWVFWRKLDRIRNSHAAVEKFHSAVRPDTDPQAWEFPPNPDASADSIPVRIYTDAAAWPDDHEEDRWAVRSQQPFL